VRVCRKDAVKDIRGGVPLARSYAGIMTPLELVDLAHLRHAREPMDREHASPLDVAEVARVTLTSTAPNIVPRLL
jgi:hypothetical protein